MMTAGRPEVLHATNGDLSNDTRADRRSQFPENTMEDDREADRHPV